MTRKQLFIQLAEAKTLTSTGRKASEQLEEQLWGLKKHSKQENTRAKCTNGPKFITLTQQNTLKCKHV